MEEIKKGIVFSNDIEYILKGNNALKFSYENNGMMIPNSSFILQLRENFRSDGTNTRERIIRLYAVW